MSAFMHKVELQTIEKHLNEDTVMFEWGSGESTLHFSKIVKHITSIEHEKQWFDKLNKNISDNVELIYVAPNQLISGKVPEAKDSDISIEFFEELVYLYPHITDHNIRRYFQFQNYVNIIDTMDTFDVILIDGRARGMCAEASRTHLTQNGVIMIHDFWNRYGEYGDQFFDVFEEVERAERLAIVRPKEL